MLSHPEGALRDRHAVWPEQRLVPAHLLESHDRRDRVEGEDLAVVVPEFTVTT